MNIIKISFITFPFLMRASVRAPVQSYFVFSNSMNALICASAVLCNFLLLFNSFVKQSTSVQSLFISQDLMMFRATRTGARSRRSIPCRRGRSDSRRIAQIFRMIIAKMLELCPSSDAMTNGAHFDNNYHSSTYFYATYATKSREGFRQTKRNYEGKWQNRILSQS